MIVGRLKKDAVEQYRLNMYNKFGNGVPESQEKFEKVIKGLQGQIFFVEDNNNNKIFLDYPKQMRFTTPNGKEIKGLEVEKNLVDLFKVEEILK